MWYFRVPQDSGENVPLSSYQKTAAGSGSKTPKWLRQLGLDPLDFDDEVLNGFKVIVDVAVKTNGDGDLDNRVKDVTLPHG